MSETQAAEVVDEGSTAPDTVEVSAVLTHDISHVWHVLSTNDGVAAFLGEGAKLGNKGEHWQAADGTHGVLAQIPHAGNSGRGRHLDLAGRVRHGRFLERSPIQRDRNRRLRRLVDLR